MKTAEINAAADKEAQRALTWDTTRQLPRAVRAELAVLLEYTRQQKFANLPGPFTTPTTRNEWTDLELVYADAAERLIAVTPVGELWRVVTLLMLEAAGDTVDIGCGLQEQNNG